jgi:hypothetical protein
MAVQVISILKDEELKKNDPNALIQAARIAGAYRLADCAPHIVSIMALRRPGDALARLRPGPGRGPNIHEATRLLRKLRGQHVERDMSWWETTELIRASETSRALIRIGKPSVPHLLKLASSEDASREELSMAAFALGKIEGELAETVVENYVRRSRDPEKTRKLLERREFREALHRGRDTKEEAPKSDGEGRIPDGQTAGSASAQGGPPREAQARRAEVLP